MDGTPEYSLLARQKDLSKVFFLYTKPHKIIKYNCCCWWKIKDICISVHNVVLFFHRHLQSPLPRTLLSRESPPPGGAPCPSVLHQCQNQDEAHWPEPGPQPVHAASYHREQAAQQAGRPRLRHDQSYWGTLLRPKCLIYMMYNCFLLYYNYMIFYISNYILKYLIHVLFEGNLRNLTVTCMSKFYGNYGIF